MGEIGLIDTSNEYFRPVVYSADGNSGPLCNNTFFSADKLVYNGTCCLLSGLCGLGRISVGRAVFWAAMGQKQLSVKAR